MAWSNSDIVERFAKQGKTQGRSANIFIEGDTLYDYGYHFPMLIRTPFGLLMNADKYSSTTTHHQSICSRYANVLIPFSILRNANIRRDDIEFIAQNQELIQIISYRKVIGQKNDKPVYKYISPKQFSELAPEDKPAYQEVTERRPSAFLFRANGKHYLSAMDVDWRYFLVELPEPCQTIEDAYESLKPKELGDRSFSRQGEWFFVETEAPQSLFWKQGDNKGMYKSLQRNYSLPRPSDTSHEHIATRGGEINGHIYASGQIRHSEHGMLKLSTSDNPKIFEVFRNRALQSFSADGRRID